MIVGLIVRGRELHYSLSMSNDADGRRSAASDLGRPTLLRGEDWYHHPKWYDVLHWPGTMAECRGLERIARRFAGCTRGGPVFAFEPGCGTARHLRGLARRGHRGVGLDLAEPMLEYGRRRLERNGAANAVRLVAGDMTDFAPADVLPEDAADSAPGFDLAFCLANSVRHLPSDDAFVRHLRCVADVLRPSGVYALGLGLTVYGLEEESEDIWRGSRGSLSVTQMVQYLPAEAESRTERVVSQLAVNRPQGEVFVEHGYDLRSYDGPQFAAALEAAGMQVVGAVDEEGWDLEWAGEPDAWRGGEWMGYAVWLLRPG